MALSHCSAMQNWKPSNTRSAQASRGLLAARGATGVAAGAGVDAARGVAVGEGSGACAAGVGVAPSVGSGVLARRLAVAALADAARAAAKARAAADAGDKEAKAVMVGETATELVVGESDVLETVLLGPEEAVAEAVVAVTASGNTAVTVAVAVAVAVGVVTAVSIAGGGLRKNQNKAPASKAAPSPRSPQGVEDLGRALLVSWAGTVASGIALTVSKSAWLTALLKVSELDSLLANWVAANCVLGPYSESL